MHSFILVFEQFYLGCRCAHVSYMRHFFAYFAVEHGAAFKPAFRAGFQSGHYDILWTGPYQVIVPVLASTNK